MEQLCKLYKKYYYLIFTLLLILFLISLGTGENLKKIEIGEVSAIYNTIVAFVPEKYLMALQRISFPIGVLLVISIILFAWKKRMNVLCHVSLAHGMAPLSPNVKKEYYIKEKNLDIVGYSYPNDLHQIITEQDSAIKDFTATKGIHSYYGIAHTPLVFRAGYMYGDQQEIHLFHRAHNNSANFEEWDTSADTKWETSFKEITEENKSCKSNNLIVAISTSLEIKNIEIASITDTKCHIIRFQLQTLEFDIIGNYAQAENLRKQILSKIREIVKKYDIQCIHMVISSSVAFTFFLGAGFSSQHDPNVIVYHYDNGKYIWGIDMKRNGSDAVIIP